MGVVKNGGVKCHFVILNSVLSPLYSVFAPMIDVKMGCHFNNSMFFLCIFIEIWMKYSR